tara:strand:+ start:137 stop:361 length:225 start_codon:yes stop_codon:yes gene_type:complete
MTLYDFNILELNDRMEAVNQLGTLIDNDITKKNPCNHSAINMLFVEVVYDSYYQTITNITAFKTGKNLDKYSKF